MAEKQIKTIKIIRSGPEYKSTTFPNSSGEVRQWAMCW